MITKIRSVKRVIIRIAIIVATCAVVLGTLRIIQVYFTFQTPVFAGYGWREGIEPLEKITDDDMEVVTGLLDGAGIPYKITEKSDGVLVQLYSYKRATSLLRLLDNCGYEFDGDILD